jgi:hypothetical protein
MPALAVPHRLVAGVPERALGGGVPLHHSAVGAHHDDAVERRVEDRAGDAVEEALVTEARRFGCHCSNIGMWSGVAEAGRSCGR